MTLVIIAPYLMPARPVLICLIILTELSIRESQMNIKGGLLTEQRGTVRHLQT